MSESSEHEQALILYERAERNLLCSYKPRASRAGLFHASSSSKGCMSQAEPPLGSSLTRLTRSQYWQNPTAAMEIESGLTPAWIRLQTKVLSSLTRMQALSTDHAIYEFLSEGLCTRTAAVIHRTNIENILQQFEITTTGTLNAISPFTRPPWCPAVDTQRYEAMDNAKHTAYTEKQSWIKRIKAAAFEQWNLNANAPLS